MPTYTVRINGRTHEVEGDPDDSLLSVLRYDLDLTGSKFGCGEGACGACTVLIDNQAARSCVTRLNAVAGKAVTTIEGLGGQQLHPVQQAFLDAEAFQCGYCTPGMVIATVSLLRTNPAPSDADIARVMDRNVCRCGTYPRIVRAVKLAAERMKAAGSADSGVTSMNRPADPEIEVERYELFEAAPYRFELERREFMRIFSAMGGGLLVFASMPGTSAQESGRGGQQGASSDVSAWVHIDEKGHITGYTGKTEIGQNIRTSLAQAIADELRVPLDRVSLVMADTDLVPFDQGTFDRCRRREWRRSSRAPQPRPARC